MWKEISLPFTQFGCWWWGSNKKANLYLCSLFIRKSKQQLVLILFCCWIICASRNRENQSIAELIATTQPPPILLSSHKKHQRPFSTIDQQEDEELHQFTPQFAFDKSKTRNDLLLSTSPNNSTYSGSRKYARKHYAIKQQESTLSIHSYYMFPYPTYWRKKSVFTCQVLNVILLSLFTFFLKLSFS